MTNITALFADAAVFVFLPWVLWRLLYRTIPIVVLPILIGIVISVWHFPVKSLGIPSVYGSDIGWVAVLVLAFTAGLEMWQPPEETAADHALPDPSLGRLLGGAAVALGGPLLVGSVLAYECFQPPPRWHASSDQPGGCAVWRWPWLPVCGAFRPNVVYGSTPFRARYTAAHRL